MFNNIPHLYYFCRHHGHGFRFRGHSGGGDLFSDEFLNTYPFVKYILLIAFLVFAGFLLYCLLNELVNKSDGKGNRSRPKVNSCRRSDYDRNVADRYKH